MLVKKNKMAVAPEKFSGILLDKQVIMLIKVLLLLTNKIMVVSWWL